MECRLRQRSNEKDGAKHEQGGKRDLGDHQDPFEADRAAPFHAGPGSFQGGRDVDASGFEGRRQSEDDSCTQRDRKSEREHAPVECGRS